MSLTIDLESIDGICIGIAEGALTLAEIKESAATMWRLAEGPDVRMLWDLRKAKFDLDVSQVSDLADTVKQMVASSDSRIAFVVTENLEFGLLRMYEAFRHSDTSRTSVFRDRDKAIAWLEGSAD
jgi:hypothetical protein